MHTPDFIRNFEKIKRVQVNSNKKLLERLILSVIDFVDENNVAPNLLCINENIFSSIRELFFKNKQLEIPFIEEEIQYYRPSSSSEFATDKGIFLIFYISKDSFDYLRIKTPNKNYFSVNFCISDISDEDIFLIYDSLDLPKDDYYIETNPNLLKQEFFPLDIELIKKRFLDFLHFNDILSVECVFKEDLSFYENIITSIDNFLYEQHKMPKVILVSEKKHEMLESLRNKGMLYKEMYKINSGMLSEVQITIDNECRVHLLVENENKVIIHVLPDNELNFSQYILVFDESFPDFGFDDNDDDDDEDPEIIPPVNSPVLCEALQ